MDNMKLGIIYIATNLINGKAYIGQTVKSLDCRSYKHYFDANIKERSGKPRHTYAFANALRKYKKSNWSWRILYKDIPKDMLCVAETCAIYTFNTYFGGYNSTRGGQGINGYKHKKETRIKLSKSRKGKNNPNYGNKRSKESKQKISGKNNPMYGKNAQLKTPARKGKFKGVCWDKSKQKWAASIEYKRKRYYLGRFDLEVEAARAYNKKALELFGESCYLNNV